jgi:hypothetical protein
MSAINPVGLSPQLQAHLAEMQAAAQTSKPALSDPDHDGDNETGGIDTDHGTDVKA